MNHGLAQVLGAGAPLRMPQCDIMAFTIALDDVRVFDGNVGSALLEIEHRITFGGHHFTDQAVRFDESMLRVVNLARLNRAPGVLEAGAIGRIKRTNGKALNAFFEAFEFGFGRSSVAGFSQSAIVFGPKPLLQTLRAITLEDVNGGRTENDDPNYNDHDQGSSVHRIASVAVRNCS
jgi:hypothetical protein